MGRALVLLTLAGLAAISTAARIRTAPLIPSPSDLISNFWAGAIAAVGAVYLQRIALVKRDPISVAKGSTRGISPELLHYVRTAAAEAGVNEIIALVFLIAEDIQRPRWYRWFEYRLPGRKGRTTGIMQQKGARSDKESIDLAIINYLLPATLAVRANHKEEPMISENELMPDMLDRCTQLYSEDPQFRKFVVGLYYNLSTDSEWLSLVHI